MALPSRRLSKRNQNVLRKEASDSDSSESNLSDDSQDSQEFHKFKKKSQNKLSKAKENRVDQSGDDHLYSKSYETQSCQNMITRSRRVRKRTHDDSEDDTVHKRSKCTSKNAVMARMNRERKKLYINGLENENESLKSENQLLKKRLALQDSMLGKCKNEVIYLRSLIANSKEIGSILKNLCVNTGLKVTSSSFPLPKVNGESKRSPSNEDGYISGGELDKFEHGNGIIPYIQPKDEPYPSESVQALTADDVNLGSLFERDSEIFENCYDFGLNNLPLSLDDEMMHDFLQDSEANLSTSIDNSSEASKFQTDELLPDVGLCLHINNKKVSLELCSLCNTKASQA